MAKPTFLVPVEYVSGKPKKRAKGYYYVRNGKQFYRERNEVYQHNQSPKQIWRSQSFTYAQKQMAGKLSSEEAAALNDEWLSAKKLSPSGHLTTTAIGWKKSVLMHQWQLQHPFEAWYEEYLTTISDAVAERTSAANLSQFQIKKQIEVLTAQLNELRTRLE